MAKEHSLSQYLFLVLMLLLPISVVGCDDDPTAPPSTATVMGQVLDAEGEGVSDALIRLNAPVQPTRTVTSDSEGTWAFEGIPPADYTVSVDPPEGWILAPAEGGFRTAPLAAGESESFIFLLSPALSEGRVLGVVQHDGSGVAHVEVLLRAGPGDEVSVRTDAFGSFGFQGLEPGGRELEIIPPDYFELADGESVVRSVTFPEEGTTRVNVELLPVTAQQVQVIEAGPQLVFNPDSVSVEPGTRIRWVHSSTDQIRYTITPDGHTAWERRELGVPGEAFDVTLNNPGVYEYFSDQHQAGGMTGTIVVTGTPPVEPGG